MARKPKTPPTPEHAAAASVLELAAPDKVSAAGRRSRRPKAPAPSPALRPAAGVGDPAAYAVEADSPTAVPSKTPGRRGPGRKQKQRADSEVAALPLDAAVEQAGAEADPPAARPGQAAAEGDARVVRMASPLDDAGASDAAEDGARLDEAAPGNVLSSTAPAKAARTAPAARWDRATGAVGFDWPEIERMAAQAGPNQAMATLLVAARAEGANSRWPF